MTSSAELQLAGGIRLYVTDRKLCHLRMIDLPQNLMPHLSISYDG
jgi:hypothetical protein